MSDHCQEAMEQIYTYLDREVDDATAERIRYHLGDCPPCGQMFAFEQRLQVVIKMGMREQVPVELLERLRTVIRGESGGS